MWAPGWGVCGTQAGGWGVAASMLVADGTKKSTQLCHFEMTVHTRPASHPSLQRNTLKDAIDVMAAMAL